MRLPSRRCLITSSKSQKTLLNTRTDAGWPFATFSFPSCLRLCVSLPSPCKDRFNVEGQALAKEVCDSLCLENGKYAAKTFHLLLPWRREQRIKITTTQTQAYHCLWKPFYVLVKMMASKPRYLAYKL